MDHLRHVVEELGGAWGEEMSGVFVVAQSAATCGGEPCTFVAASAPLNARGHFAAAPGMSLLSPLPIWHGLSNTTWLPTSCLVPSQQRASRNGDDARSDDVVKGLRGVVACQMRLLGIVQPEPDDPPWLRHVPVTLCGNFVTVKGAKGRRLAHVSSAIKHMGEGVDEHNAYALAESRLVEKEPKVAQLLDSLADVYASLVQVAAAEGGSYGGYAAGYNLLPRTCMSHKSFENGEGDILEAVFYRVGGEAGVCAIFKCTV